MSPIRARLACGGPNIRALRVKDGRRSLLAAVMHIGWALLVAAGFGQKLADFVFRIHFIAPIYQVEPFELGRALILVAVSFSGAFVLAALGGAIWNRFNRA